MLLDILIILAIIALAMILGLTVHPLFWVILVAVVIWIAVRHGSRRGSVA
jgi:hypothetical protein